MRYARLLFAPLSLLPALPVLAGKPASWDDCVERQAPVSACVALIHAATRSGLNAKKPSDRKDALFYLRWVAVSPNAQVRRAAARGLISLGSIHKSGARYLVSGAAVLRHVNQLRPKDRRRAQEFGEPWPLDVQNGRTCALHDVQPRGGLRYVCGQERCVGACFAQPQTVVVIQDKRGWRLVSWEVGRPHDKHHGCGICY